jgi:hypothetical protein
MIKINPEKRVALLVERATRVLEAHYDSVARQRRYDDRYTCALRAGFNGPFQAEGQAFAAWMDACNAHAYGVLELVKSGERETPTAEALIAELPEMTWPEV